MSLFKAEQYKIFDTQSSHYYAGMFSLETSSMSSEARGWWPSWRRSWESSLGPPSRSPSTTATEPQGHAHKGKCKNRPIFISQSNWFLLCVKRYLGVTSLVTSVSTLTYKKTIFKNMFALMITCYVILISHFSAKLHNSKYRRRKRAANCVRKSCPSGFVRYTYCLFSFVLNACTLESNSEMMGEMMKFLTIITYLSDFAFVNFIIILTGLTFMRCTEFFTLISLI